MRLNAKTHPSYIKMMEGRISEIPLEPRYMIKVSQANPMIPEMMMEAIRLTLEEREKVWYCTDSFFNAAMTAIKKIDGVSWDAIHSHSGVFITNWAHVVYNVQQDSEIPLSIYIFNKEYLIGNLMFNR